MMTNKRGKRGDWCADVEPRKYFYMANVNGNKIENLKPFKAYERGYLTRGELRTHEEWVKASVAERKNVTFVYANGVYLGVSTRLTVLADIIDKFHLDAPALTKVG